MDYSLHSRKRTRVPSAKVLAAEEDVEAISQKLAEVIKIRKSLNFTSPSQRSFSSSVSSERSSVKSSEKSFKKKQFHHPSLDLLMTKMVYSPYMTKPGSSYSKHTIDAPEKVLLELKAKSCKLNEIPVNEAPFNLNNIKKKFVNEIAKYSTAIIYTKISPSLKRKVHPFSPGE
jgi:hypothetical protein